MIRHILRFALSSISVLGLAFSACGGGGKGGNIMTDGTNKNRVLKFDKLELQKRLTPEQYNVTCENGTERAFANAYWNNHREGIYVDIISGDPLFSSSDKFDSGTGWPSFTKPISRDLIAEKEDQSYGIVRVEVRGKSADGHLGHVFDDGPAPTGLRYCINSASLRFVPAEDMEKEGYGKYLYLFPGYGKKAPSNPPAKKTEKAIFGAGCFWGAEAYFDLVKGVVGTRVGYAGGTLRNPTYEDVCTGRTGHAEVVEVEYDPSVVTYERLLYHFWKIHDPTSLNRQGNDAGSQYRSIIFYFTPEQEKAARLDKERLDKSGRYPRRIVTEIVKAGDFYPAEDYQQKYLKKNPGGYCHIDLKHVD